jgi:hypothetical protein
MVLPKNRTADRQRSEPRRVERRPDVRSIATVALDQIKPHPRNPRTHSKKQIRQIADSIQAVGFASCPFRKSHPDIFVMQSGQEGNSAEGVPRSCPAGLAAEVGIVRDGRHYRSKHSRMPVLSG